MVCVDVISRIFNRDKSGFDYLTFTSRWPIDMLRSNASTCIRKTVHAFLQHEADEWLTVDGVQVHDPHASEKELVP
jgi:hypothetical protein